MCKVEGAEKTETSKVSKCDWMNFKTSSIEIVLEIKYGWLCSDWTSSQKN